MTATSVTGSSRPPSPNRGAALLDTFDVGDKHLTQDDFRKKYGVDKSSQIKLVKISFMEYQVPDLQKAHIFLKDFGFTRVKKTENDIWYRGYGPDPYVYHLRRGPRKFLGGAYQVETYQDLEKAIAIPGVKVLTDGIEELTNAPGGGHIVTLEDPEGFPVSLVYGQAPGEAKDMPVRLEFNEEVDKPRKKAFHRFKAGPAAVYKLGHYGLVCKDFATQCAFYTRNFNLIPTNFLYIEVDGVQKEVGMFAHVDRGEELVDHHTFFCVTLPPGHETPHVHHSSYEIHDIDTQAQGHDWLTKKGYEPAWGLGRHILGSQIFDYWWDPEHFMVEHYIDGDIVNRDTPVTFHQASSAKDAAWGPDVPGSFLE